MARFPTSISWTPIFRSSTSRNHPQPAVDLRSTPATRYPKPHSLLRDGYLISNKEFVHSFSAPSPTPPNFQPLSCTRNTAQRQCKKVTRQHQYRQSAGVIPYTSELGVYVHYVQYSTPKQKATAEGIAKACWARIQTPKTSMRE